ncbi:BCCT family transporter [Pseudoalteromonas sp. B193]
MLTLVFDPTVTRDALTSTKDAIINQFDSYFMLLANAFVIFCVILAFSPLGKIRLGGVKARPEHGYMSWLSMLFAAGMGIGLLFWELLSQLHIILVGIICLWALSQIHRKHTH